MYSLTYTLRWVLFALSFPVIIVSNRTYEAPLGRESEFPRTRVATWRSRDLYRTGIPIALAIRSLDLSARLILQKTKFLTVRSIRMHLKTGRLPKSEHSLVGLLKLARKKQTS